jgi:hypothetical protein
MSTAVTVGIIIIFLIIFYCFLFYFCSGIHCEVYKSPYIMLNISYLKSPPLLFSFTLFPPIPGLVLQVSFLHLHKCVHSICTIFTILQPFPTPPPSHYYQPFREDLFCSLILWFCKRKKWHFVCLRKQWASFWYLHTYIYIYIYIYIYVCM